MSKYFLSIYYIFQTKIDSPNESNQEKKYPLGTCIFNCWFSNFRQQTQLKFSKMEKKSLYLRRYQIVSENKQIANCTILPEVSSLNQLQKLWKE